MQTRAQPPTPPQLPPMPSTLGWSALGIPQGETQDALKADHYKELINKIAWALGSAYDCSYTNIQQPARKYAQVIVGAIIRDHGFPRKAAK